MAIINYFFDNLLPYCTMPLSQINMFLNMHYYVQLYKFRIAHNRYDAYGKHSLFLIEIQGGG